MSNVTAADILERAAEVIETSGLTHGSYGDVHSIEGRHCTVGAIMAAGHELGIAPSKLKVYDKLSDHLRDEGLLPEGLRPAFAGPSGLIMSWNDGTFNSYYHYDRVPEPNRDDVIEALRQCAKDLRNDAKPCPD